ncbi:MAG: transposase [Bacteroidetes bacterium]|nr:transposase [Bacteroidota bacterium]MBT5529416.1 transposase [Cytophagia bacterium]MBT3421613.1 transposase [Bacteroidota bacterium]MBT3802213.1 transposase [Bacteroidota bacterium]MBT3933002.1 transposase [Bacteroidota bacterium]
MSTAYKFSNPDGIYFVTFTTVEWVDVFTRLSNIEIVLDSLRFCQKDKGLLIHAWCIMSNHMHLIISRNAKDELAGIVRDFKKFTSSMIIKAIQEKPESRRNWMLWIFKSAGQKNPNNKNFQVWQQDNHPEELISNKFIDQKLDYIHNNILETGIVENAEDYLYSSARDYAGLRGLLDIEFLT